MKAETLAQLIETSYRAVTDDEVTAGIAETVRVAFDAGSASIFSLDGNSGALGPVLTTHPDEALQQYRAYYHRLDPWHPHVMARIGTPALGSELIDDTSLARSEFYNDFGRRTGTFHMMILSVPLDSHGRRFVNLSLNRPKDSSAFNDEALRQLAELAPHVGRMTQLRFEMSLRERRLAETMLEASIDLLPHPAFVTDGYGRVRCANAMARQVRSVIDRGGLSLHGRPNDQRLRHAIENAAAGGVGGTILVHGSVVTAGRLPASFAPSIDVSSLVLVIVRPLVEDRGALSKQCMLTLGLTAAEADVIAGIAAGDAPKQVAARRSVGLETVRTLIKRALERTGCSSLRDLTGLVLRLPPPP